MRRATASSSGGKGVALRVVGWSALVVGLALVPFVFDEYRVLLGTEILIYALFAISFNLLFGYTGLLSFGHAAYFAAGAYGSAFVLEAAEAPIWLAIPAGVVAGGALAALFGIFCVRLNEIYFSLLTLAFGMLVYTVAFQARGTTGGSDGYKIFEADTLSIGGFQYSLGQPEIYYWLSLVVVVTGIGFLRRVVMSPFGQTLRAIRENEERVRFLGVPVRRYKFKAFVVAGAMAGLAGALIAPFLRVAHPSMAHWTTSAEVVLGTILGGAAFFLGPAIGTGALIWLESVVTGTTVYWPLVMGLILLGLVLFFSRGIIGTVDHLRSKLRGRGS